jgi:hypothetical protein
MKDRPILEFSAQWLMKDKITELLIIVLAQLHQVAHWKDRHQSTLADLFKGSI